MFYYLFGWERRHLHTGGSCPVVWAGVCDYEQFWSLAGRVAQSAEAMPNFSFCYVTSRKNLLFCAPILYTVVPATAGHRWFGAKVAGRGRWPLVTGNGHMRHYVKSSKYIRQHTFCSTSTTL